MKEAGMVRIALPGLADSAAHCAGRGEAVRLPAAEWLVARGECRPGVRGDWRRWVLAEAGLGADALDRFPAGPCVFLARTGREPQGCWACAEPVHLLTALDHLQLGSPVPLPLDAAERGELVQALNDHFADSGFRLHAMERGGWLCECPPGLRCAACEPAAAIGGNLRDLQPVGLDAARIRALVNEAQMLLHEHPVNARRAARGEPVVNSVWLWGIGSASACTAGGQGTLVSDDDWLVGLWRLHGGAVRPVAELAGVLARADGAVRVAIAPDPTGSGAAAELARLERDVLEPLRESLVAGRVPAATLCVGGWIIELDARARWRFWRRGRPLAQVLA
jgi:hypothetical protein